MKGIAVVVEPPRGKRAGWFGAVARAQWKHIVYRRRFSANRFGGIDEAVREAADWIRYIERKVHKPRSEKWVRSAGNGYRMLRDASVVSIKTGMPSMDKRAIWRRYEALMRRAG